MAQEGDVKLGQLARFIFTAPSWKRSLVLILLLGFLIDGANAKAWLNLNLASPVSFTLPTLISNYFSLPEQFLFSGTLAFTIPAIAALVLTKKESWGTRLWAFQSVVSVKPARSVPGFFYSFGRARLSAALRHGAATAIQVQPVQTLHFQRDVSVQQFRYARHARDSTESRGSLLVGLRSKTSLALSTG